MHKPSRFYNIIQQSVGMLYPKIITIFSHFQYSLGSFTFFNLLHREEWLRGAYLWSMLCTCGNVMHCVFVHIVLIICLTEYIFSTRNNRGNIYINSDNPFDDMKPMKRKNKQRRFPILYSNRSRELSSSYTLINLAQQYKTVEKVYKSFLGVSMEKMHLPSVSYHVCACLGRALHSRDWTSKLR